MKLFFQKIYLGLVYSLLYIPILVLILYSFNKARFSLQWKSFSIHWYQELLQDKGLWTALFHSAYLGLSASLIATTIGVAACLSIFLHPNYKRYRSFHATLLMMIVIPDIVLGVALLIFFNSTGIPLGFCSLLIAHITFCIPFVVLTINSRLHTLDVSVYASAQDLGASRFTAITKIVLPLLWPAIFSACLLCFTLSFDDVIISYFVAGPSFNILPLTIYSLVRAGVTPELNALCTLTFFISMVLVIFSYRMSGQSK